jgi:holin-like protein
MKNSLKQIWAIGWQIGVLFLASSAGTFLADHFHLKVPGSMLGMALVFVLLRLKVLRLDWLEKGANWLLGELLLFFIPAAVGIIQYRQVMMADGSRIMLVIAVSTLAVMICTGLLAEFVIRRKEGETP